MLDLFLDLGDRAKVSFEMSADFQRTTQHYFSEERTLTDARMGMLNIGHYLIYI
jgi:hypothetical protein